MASGLIIASWICGGKIRGEDWEGLLVTRDKQRIAVEFSRFVRERVDHVKKNNRMSDPVLRYMEKKRRPFGKEIDHKLLFVYKKQFAKVTSRAQTRLF